MHGERMKRFEKNHVAYIVIFYTPDSDQVIRDRSLFRGPCEVARANFPLDAYDIVLISFKGSDGICRILVQEVKRK